MKNIINILITARYDEECRRIIAILSEQNDFNIAGVEEDEAKTIIKSEQIKPDVLVIDLPSSLKSAHEIAPVIHRRTPQTAIVMLCDREDGDYAGLALESGITGFLLKEKDMDKLALVIRIVYNGGYYISTPIFISILNAITSIYDFPGRMAQNNYRSFLTRTERGVIEDIARGLSYKEIANHLHLSFGTIKNSVCAVKRKTKLKNREQIVVYSLLNGLIGLEQFGFDFKAMRANIEKAKQAGKPGRPRS